MMCSPKTLSSSLRQTSFILEGTFLSVTAWYIGVNWVEKVFPFSSPYAGMLSLNKIWGLKRSQNVSKVSKCLKMSLDVPKCKKSRCVMDRPTKEKTWQRKWVILGVYVWQFWGFDCMSVRPTVRSPLWAIQPGLRPSQPGMRPSQPHLKPSQPGLRPSLQEWLAGPQAWLDGGWPRGGNGRSDWWTDGRTNIWKISPFYRTSSPIRAAAQKRKKENTKEWKMF